MKITPLSSGTGEPGTVIGNVEVGTNQARATTVEESRIGDIKRRRQVMRTNATPESFSPEIQETVEQTQEIEPKPAISDPNKDAQAAEATKPLSPQFAALARQRRELQKREQALQAKERALAEQPQGQGIDLEKVKADPLGVLRQAGVSYDDLTQAILQNPIPTNTVDTESLKKELLEAIKQDLGKSFEERDSQTEAEVINQMTREANLIVSRSEDFDLISRTRSVPDAIELIKRTYKESGELMDVEEALRLVEDDLAEQLTPIAQSKKIQSRLQPKQPAQPQPQQMRTLTSRDSAQAPMSRKQRAMAAFYGKLK